ncbi:MAG: hypothetical protein JST75_22120 [Bacteroidetes bacterium]|nr:hypothetical protein [Bacteroidota bacterium]
MRGTRKLFYIPFMFFVVCVHGQPSRRVWLGDGMDSLFVKDEFHSRVFDSTVVFYGLGAERVYYESTELADNEHNIINAGILLKAKSTDKQHRGIRAVFTDGNDSCEAKYEVKTNITTIGRSATLSLLNLFAKPEYKVPQSDPVAIPDLIEIAGKISTSDGEHSFKFVNDHRVKAYHPEGWLVLTGDTFYIKPITTQVNKHGKLKHPKNIPDIGYLLIKGETICAAVDQFSSPFNFYLRDSLNKKEKLVITAFLFSTMDH